MESKFDVKTMGIKYVCDKCQKGDMIPTQMKTAEEPVKYQHRCSNCGDLKLFEKTYPAIEYTVV